ncbi:hypothetical protein F5Y19DRAFT_420957 [Xylariaceae sp. FL1651]|nr:hypothetical protein F5Y19DRAFT_420957 [Xylariaceae sp. FL1651]
MQRLIVTGKDTPKNLSIFSGQADAIYIDETHQEARIGALLCPPLGLSSYVLNQYSDENCPYWNPREPSAVETEKVQGVRDMQEMIRRYITCFLNPPLPL